MGLLSSDDELGDTALPQVNEVHVSRAEAMAACMAAVFSDSDEEDGTDHRWPGHVLKWYDDGVTRHSFEEKQGSEVAEKWGAPTHQRR